MIAGQSLMLLLTCCLIFAFFNIDQGKRISELERRQTNHLVYLEQRVNNVDSRLDAVTNEIRHNLKVMETRKGQ
ncbi:hypothetical protein A7D27_06390 [Pseudomonas sp. 1D4]|nr:hypothetical protein A7D27_06390 [Pseudomonas sp. 1D4]